MGVSAEFPEGFSGSQRPPQCFNSFLLYDSRESLSVRGDSSQKGRIPSTPRRIRKLHGEASRGVERQVSRIPSEASHGKTFSFVETFGRTKHYFPSYAATGSMAFLASLSALLVRACSALELVDSHACMFVTSVSCDCSPKTKDWTEVEASYSEEKEKTSPCCCWFVFRNAPNSARDSRALSSTRILRG